MSSLEAAWNELSATAEAGAPKILDLFAREPDRLSRLTLEACGIRLDLSKQSWSLAGLDATLLLARTAGVETSRDAMFAGAAINSSEGRAVLHMALRAPAGENIQADGEPVMEKVQSVRTAMKAFSDDIRSGRITASDGKPFTSILHIGIGGSDLGPRFVWDALQPVRPQLDLRFVANVDGAEFALTTADLDPSRTLVVIVSKTFTTQETMANAAAARAWLVAAVGAGNVSAHLCAVSTALDHTARFGVLPERVFGFWDWVGGRYSLWSAVGLSLAIALGWDAFDDLLGGAWSMDSHFRTAPLERNAPVLLALSHIYNRNVLSRASRTVVPYSHRLRRFAAFLQQLEMESNGKTVTAQGKPVRHATATAVFGDEGSNVQHAYFQALHQGSDIIPVDFIAVAQAQDGPQDMHLKLLANVLAQAEAMMVGRSETDVRAELAAKGLSADAMDQLAPQRTFAGNRPSNLLLLDRLTPASLGALIALYEHKTFVEGVIWQVNSFDQWGVELGKVLAGRILEELTSPTRHSHDPSTTALISRLAL